MKKITLKNLNLKEVEQLSREQLKNVLGGYMDGTGGGTDGGTEEVGGPGCKYTCECDYGSVEVGCEGLTVIEMAEECIKGCL